MNHYEILEVQPGAPQHEIYKAYVRARSIYSQDNPALYSMFSREESRELLRLIEEAHRVLSNPSLRLEYDQRLIRGDFQRPLTSASDNLSLAPVDAMVPDPSIPGSHAAPEAIPPAPRPVLMRMDFETPSPAAPSSRAGGLQNLPPGHGKTALGTYVIDEQMEAEIRSVEDVDGAFLQKVRSYKCVSLDAMAEHIRVSKSYITAVESNDYESLPAGVFVRGFVVQMCKALGLPDQSIASRYMQKFKAGGGKT
jgi:curved DNA-binding protein CbpA